MSGHPFDRRTFLKGGLSLPLLGLAGAAPTRDYPVTGWLGDEYDFGHRVRDGAFQQRPAPSEKREVVVVGAGIAGMTAAFRLRELDMVVLDHASKPGGNSKSERRGEHEFNIGAAYFTGNSGVQAELWGELGLDLKPVPGPTDRWNVGGEWLGAPFEDETIAAAPAGAQRPLRELKAALRAVVDGPDFPQNPYEGSTPAALKLDTMTFSEWLKPYAHPDVLAFINSYCHSALGASPDVLSAYAGVNFVSEFLDDIYAFPSGNAHLIRLMHERIDAAGAGRLRTGCMAYRIEARDDGATVYYVQNDEARAIEAKRVVVAVPYFVASRILANLAEGQRYALGSPGYASYFVVNLVFDSVVSRESYDNWTPGMAMDDFIPADWVGPRRDDIGQVISAFACSRRPVVGRWRMMTIKPEEVADPVVAAFGRAVPGSLAHLREAIVTRWGHAILINRPGMYTQWLPNLKKRIGAVWLAHSDGQALPALESATNDAIVAASGILEGWTRR